MRPLIALKTTLKPGSIALALALMLLTTICHAQHNVVYWNGDSTYLQTLATSYYTDVIVNFVTPDQNCDLSWGGSTPNGGLPSDIGTSIQTLHNAGKNVLVSFGGSDVQSWQYASCAGNVQNLVSQIAGIVAANDFNGADIDFEDTNAFLNSWDPYYSGYDGVQFLVQLTIGLYGQLPQGQNIITHAPQSPYWYPVGDPKAEGFNWALSAGNGGPYTYIFLNTRVYTPTPVPMISWINNQFYENPVDDQDDATKVSTYEDISHITGPDRLLLGVIIDNSTEGYISSGWVWQDVVQPLQTYSTTTFGLPFGGVMAWDYANDVNVWGYWWGVEAGEALGIPAPRAEKLVPGNSQAGPSAHAKPSAHAGPSKRHSRCGAGTKNECPAGLLPGPRR